MTVTMLRAVRDSFDFESGQSHGLVVVISGGFVIDGAGAFSEIPSKHLTMTDDTTNYIERTLAGVVSSNTDGFTVGYIPLWIATTGDRELETMRDVRGTPRPAATIALGDLSDVVLDDPADGEILTFNDTGDTWGNEVAP